MSARRGARARLAAFAMSILIAAGCASASGPGANAAATRALRGAPGTFRVAVWNVAESSFVRSPDGFRAVLRKADADLFMFDEVGEAIEPARMHAVLRGLRGAADTTWHLAWGPGGGYQRTVIASREPVEAVEEFTPLAYPATRSAVLARAPGSLHAKLDADFAAGVATHAAVVRAGGRRLLVTGLDLWARGTPESWEETRRRVEAAAIRDAVRRALARLDAAGTPVAGNLVGGDMNLVAGRAPLDTLLGAARPGSRLVPVDALHDDGWSDWTWDGRGTAFHSKRMDVLLHDPARLTVLSARVLDADSMTSLSRHRPVVADFTWRD